MVRTKGPNRFGTRGLFLSLALAPGILGVGTSFVDSLQERYRLHRATNELAQHLEDARDEAIAKNVFVRVRRDGNQLVKEHSVDGIIYVRDSVLFSLPPGIRVAVHNELQNTRVAVPETNTDKLVSKRLL